MSLVDFDKIVSSGSINFCAPLSFQSKLSLFASLENNELLRLFQLSQNANMKIALASSCPIVTHKIIPLRLDSAKSFFITFWKKHWFLKKIRKELSPDWLMLVDDDEFFASQSFFTWLSFHRVHFLKTVLKLDWNHFYAKFASISQVAWYRNQFWNHF